MDKKELEAKLAGVMDAVPVCEGLIYCETNGNVIIGQTLTEMDHSGIAKGISSIFEGNLPAAEKGLVVDITIGLENGFIVAAKKENHILIGLLGEDGKTSVGLLNRQLKNIMK